MYHPQSTSTLYIYHLFIYLLSTVCAFVQARSLGRLCTKLLLQNPVSEKLYVSASAERSEGKESTSHQTYIRSSDLTVMMVQVNRYTDMPEVFMRGNML